MAYTAKCHGGPKHGEIIACVFDRFDVAKPSKLPSEWHDAYPDAPIRLIVGEYIYDNTWGDPVWTFRGWFERA